MSDGAAAVFGRVAGDYDTVIPFFRRFGERLVEVVDVQAGAEVLDVAAGRGAATFPGGFVGIEEVDDEQEFVFADELAWWAWLQTQGQRVFLDALPPDAVVDLREECFARLRPHRRPDGGYLLQQRARYTTAHR